MPRAIITKINSKVFVGINFITKINSKVFVGINFHTLLVNMNNGGWVKVWSFLEMRSASVLIGLNVTNQSNAHLAIFSRSEFRSCAAEMCFSCILMSNQHQFHIELKSILNQIFI